MRKSGNKLDDARTVGSRWVAIWVHEDDAEICLGYSVF